MGMPLDHSIRWSDPLIRQEVLDKDRTAIWNPDQFALVMGLAGVEPGCRMLDIGAGSGGMLSLFWDLLAAAPDSTLLCSDRDPDLVATIEQRLAGVDLEGRVRTAVQDAGHLELDDDAFDLTFCQMVLMHLGDPGRAVAEMARVTRPGGHVVLVEGNATVQPWLFQEAPAAAAAVGQLWHHVWIGRRALGRGDVAVGEAIPTLFSEAGLQLRHVRLVDRVSAVSPAAPSGWQVETEGMLQGALTVFDSWRDRFAEEFAAGDGPNGAFDELWQLRRELEQRRLRRVRAGDLGHLAAYLMYAAVGQVPASDNAAP